MKHSSLRFGLIVSLTLTLLYLICFLSKLALTAGEIDAVLTDELNKQCVATRQTVFDAVVLETDWEGVVWAAQSTMVNQEDSLALSYPVRVASFLWDRGTYEIMVQSRNALLVTIRWKDGTESRIPMTFRYENTADVAEMFSFTYAVPERMKNSYVEFTGFWQDGLFYLEEFCDGDGFWDPFDYKSPTDPPEDAVLETIRVSRAEAEEISVTPVMKSLGTGDYYVSYADEWRETDKVIDTVRQWQEEYVGEGVMVEKTGLFRRWWLDATAISVPNRSGAFYYYVAVYNPVSLAFGEMMEGGLPLLALGLFALVAVFLIMCYRELRDREMRSYQDEIQRQKQALEYAQGAEQSRREMTSAIAHELKTPIAVLSSYAEALQENIDREKQTHYLSVIREETEKMDRMVLELLDLSRLEAGRYKLRREDFDLTELMKEIIKPLEGRIEEKHLEIVWQVGNAQVSADRYRLGQVVENFLTNAIRHTPEGGKITLRIGGAGETFSVENQGRPIPQEQLSKVWETFWQGDASRNERGSGLGLAICRTIVTLHGGSCKVENTASGVKFSVSLAAEKKLYQLGRMPQEEVIRIDFVIPQWFITVERLMDLLRLMPKAQFRRELREGNIRMGDDVIKDPRIKLYPGYTLVWREYRIRICRDTVDTDRAIFMERMRPGTGLWSITKPNEWVGRP